jgi:uncharacterized protein (DUF362 family)
MKALMPYFSVFSGSLIAPITLKKNEGDQGIELGLGSVSIVRVVGDVAEAVERSVELLGGAKIKKGARLVVKPNLCNSKDPGGMVITDFRIIESVVFMARRATDDITIVESDNISGSAEKRVIESGLMKRIDEWGIKFRNLSRDGYEEHDVGGVRFHLPRTVLDADYLINLPKMKTEGHVLVTLSMKNLFGTLVEGKKKRLHRYLDDLLPYLSRVIRQDLIVVDGIVCMEGNGPLIGSPRCMNLVVAGTNPVEVDSVCARIMGFDPAEVKHIANASLMGLGEMDLGKIQVVGERLEEVSTRFDRPYGIRATLKSIKSVKNIYI